MSKAVIYFRSRGYTEIEASGLQDVTRFLLMNGYKIEDVKRIDIGVKEE